MIEGRNEGRALVTVSAAVFNKEITRDIEIETILGNFTGRIIVNPIIPTYLHIVAISKDPVNVPVLYARLKGKQDSIELKRKNNVWTGIYKRISVDERVEIESIKTVE